jgi:hypothetical protein
MRLRSAPALATWFLKLLCPSPEHESIIGDLVEQYQQGRGRLWYWRQVIVIVFLGLYRRATRPPLIQARRIPVGHAFAVVLVIAALVIVLSSDIWPIFLAAILGGVIIGVLKFERGGGRTAPTQPNGPRLARIDSSNIPIRGGIGAAILIAILLVGLLIELPELRLVAALGFIAGLIFAGAFRLWGRLHPRDIDKEWLSIRPK